MSVIELDQGRAGRRQSFAPGVVQGLLVEKIGDDICLKILASDAFNASAVSGMSVRLQLQTDQGMRVLTGRIEHTPAAKARASWFTFTLRLDPSPKASTFEILPVIHAIPATCVQFRLGADWIERENGYDDDHFGTRVSAG